jgi:DNA-directed RNA polymerase specialized sigma24 family protein
MRTSVGTVKQHSHRALKRLRSDLAPHTAILEADDA